MPNGNLHKRGDDLYDPYEPQFPPAGETLPGKEPSVETEKEPFSRPGMERMKSEPEAPVLKEPPVESAVPTSEVPIQEPVIEKESVLTIEEAKKTGDPDEMIRALEAEKEKEGEENE